MKKVLHFVCFYFPILCFGANDVRIYQVYPGGGNSGATYNEDFVVLFNSSSVSSVNLNGYSIQYASGNSSTWNKLDINSITIPIRGFILISVATSGTVGVALPTPDLSWSFGGASSDGFSATAGKIALMPNQTLITTAAPVGFTDFIGYGSASNVNASEGTPASVSGLTSSRSIVRQNDGQDTDQNSSDFVNSNNLAPNAIRPVNSTNFPVSLISFSGKNNNGKNLLTWATDSESNFSHFEIMRSLDAKGFESIGRIDGKGSDEIEAKYSFIDESPKSGNNYYRLKQVDNDGKTEFSKIINVSSSYNAEVLVYPNPGFDEISLRNIEKEEIETIQIRNKSGRLLKSVGNESLSLKISDLQDSNLILEIRLKNGSSLTKNIVKL